MSAAMANNGRELDVLLQRAARRGWLDVDTLLEPYCQLFPSGHPGLSLPRQVDVAAVVRTLSDLPAELFDAPRLLVVPDLGPYPYEPLGCASPWAAGRLDDGTVVLENRLGMAGIADLAASLCLLRFEADKAQELLGDAAHEAGMDAVGTDATEDAGFDAQAAEDGSPDAGAGSRADDQAEARSADTSAAADAAAYDAIAGADTGTDHVTDTDIDADTDTDTDADTDADTDVDADTNVDAGTDAETGAEIDTDADADAEADAGIDAAALSRVAFHWGSDPTSLLQGNLQTGGNLLRLLLGLTELPEVLLHADFDPTTVCVRARQRGERALAALAEMGLLTRPLHIWIGSDALTQCLSPYTRELREVLRRWGEAHRGALGDDLPPLGVTPDENVLYAVGHDFVRTDPTLRRERDTAERTVGILRYDLDGVAFEAIDLARVEPALCDARLPSWDVSEPAPVLLRLDADPRDTGADLLRTLLEAVGPSVASVTVLTDGASVGGSAGSVILPTLLIDWAGEHKLTLPVQQGLRPGDLEAFNDAPIHSGAVLTTAGTALVSTPHLLELRRRYNVAAVAVGAAGPIAVLQDCLWSGSLSADTTVSWAVVDHRRASTGRPALPTLAAHTAIAIATLRHLAPPVFDTPAKASRPSPRRSPPRPTVRIKA